jgi:hypothetical protein
MAERLRAGAACVRRPGPGARGNGGDAVTSRPWHSEPSAKRKKLAQLPPAKVVTAADGWKLLARLALNLPRGVESKP